jgi:hypothetical protein
MRGIPLALRELPDPSGFHLAQRLRLALDDSRAVPQCFMEVVWRMCHSLTHTAATGFAADSSESDSARRSMRPAATGFGPSKR